MEAAPKPTNRGRQKIEIKRIEKESKRQVTFSKRRKGLFKKAADLSRLSGAQIAILTFSLNGKAYSFSTSPHPDTITDCFLSGKKLPVSRLLGGDEDAAEEDLLWWWEQPVEENELEECLDAMKDLRENVQRRIQAMGDQSWDFPESERQTPNDIEPQKDDDGDAAAGMMPENVQNQGDSLEDLYRQNNNDGMEFVEWNSVV